MITLDKPRDGDIHSLADFTELLCLVVPDRVCDRETVKDQLHDVGEKKVSDAELDDCYAHLNWRINAFGDLYPFEISSDLRHIRSEENLTPKQEMYVLLLLCSNLPFLNNRGKITDYFELVAVRALQSTWPEKGEAFAFGKNTTLFTGTKEERINQLAKSIGGEGRCDASFFRPSDSGDGGIDLAASLPLDRYERQNILSALGQCACSRSEWAKKQTEISRTRLNSAIHASAPWQEMIFIPHCFRNNHGRWAYQGEVAGVVVYDRLRIIQNIDIEANWKASNPPPLLDDFLEYRLPLV